MKKFLYVLLAFAVALASCDKEPEIPEEEKPGPEEKPIVNPPEEEKTVTKEFTASFEAPEDGTQATWAADDKILLYDGATVQTLTNSAGAGAVAKFSATVAKDASAFLAYYPYFEGVSISGTKVTFTLPAEIPLAEDAVIPAVAKSSGTVLSFRPLMAKLVFSVGQDGITKIEFQTAGGEKITGNATVDYAGENPALSAASDKLVVSGTFVADKQYAIALPAQDYTGYSVKVYAGEKLVEEISSEAGELKPGQTLTIPTLAVPEPAANVYQISKLTLWGGTGPEYGGSKVINLFEVPDYFDNTDGRGVQALQDNYFVIKEDGTFINYAGEDARNWWYVYSKDVNPATHKNLDLKGFYEVLPRAESTYSYNVGESGIQFTFDLGGGAQSVGTYVPAGTYTLYEDKGITVTIEEQAIMFLLQGKDDWDHFGNDYNVIACRPRVLFIELHQMEEGFKVPEASKTFDTDFEFIPEDDPVVNPPAEFDLQDLLGSWNVYGNNTPKESMPKFGLYVLGGSGDDPAFVSPIDKSWDWDDTIWKESDNGLVIKATGQSGTTITGTINWWSGNDGAFWDYLWKDGTDLSAYYDVIPKGEKSYSLDATTMVVTLENGKQPKILVPGEHEFVYGKKLTIPDGCFALDFHIMDPIDATADRWYDKDRFINAPLEYIIIFEKSE